MREIIFRGKRIDNNEWVYGYYLAQNGRGIDGASDSTVHFIMEDGSTQMVNPETVGQFTGLLDKNGNKIFEGDIILDDGDELIIEYDINTSAFIGICQRKKMGYDLNSEYSYKIIGNIYA